MSNNWILHVEDFAKIRKAKIEATPLTFFVGDNNSGKSFLLSLMWGLTGGIAFHDQGASKRFKNVAELDEVQKLLDSWKNSHSNSSSAKLDGWCHLKIKRNEHEILVSGFNALLHAIKNEYIGEIFNTDDIHVKSIHVELPFYDDSEVIVKLDKEGNKSKYSWGLNLPDSSSLFADNGAFDFVSRYINTFFASNVFFPASRTGFLLTLKTLAQRSFRSMFGRDPKSGDNLTGPQVSYLERLALSKQNHAQDTEPPVQGIFNFIEQEIIDGQIIINDTRIPEILYKPNGLDRALSLHLSSGVVTEVAGFLSLLQTESRDRILIYEEPEMCLHPELQWKMARVLVKLVNAGFTVWASTHSDVIIQHVNNMIKLSNRPDKEQLRKDRGYDEDDVISPDKVRMYQFEVDPSDHKTNVLELECGQNGFRVPTFGKVVREMKDEVWSFRIEKEEATS